MNNIYSQIKQQSLLNPLEECCGLIVDSNVYPCKNIAIDKKHAFVIDPKDYLNISLKGEIQYFYHSHTYGNASISLLDCINAEKHNLPLIIYSIKKDKFLEYNPTGIKYKYIGRKFEIGVTDCYTLVRDYYKDLGIKLNDYPRNKEWYSNNPTLFEANFINGGFIHIHDLQKHDMILFKFRRKYSSHAVIYLENDLILHHPYNKLSTVENINGYKPFISHTLRHINLC